MGLAATQFKCKVMRKVLAFRTGRASAPTPRSIYTQESKRGVGKKLVIQ